MGDGDRKGSEQLHPIVISKKEERVEPGMELVIARNDEQFVRVVEEKKQEKGGDIYVPGGVRTAQRFAGLGLIDEYILMVHPVAIGEGKRLLTSKVRLKLVSTKAYKSGVIQVRCRPR